MSLTKLDKNKTLVEHKDLEQYHEKRLVRQPYVTMLTSVPKKSIPDAIEKDNFPKPVGLSQRGRAWVLKEVIDWIDELIEKRDSKIAKEKSEKKSV